MLDSNKPKMYGSLVKGHIRLFLRYQETIYTNYIVFDSPDLMVCGLENLSK